MSDHSENDAAQCKVTTKHVFLMSDGADGTRDDYWFGTAPTAEGILGVLNYYSLPTGRGVVEEFLADISALRPALATVGGRAYYLARHPHHRESG